MGELKALIQIIKTAAPTEVKAAQRRVESIWNKSCRDDGARRAFEVFLEEARDFDKIPDKEHQAYFINTLKWAFYFARPEAFSSWMDLLLGWVVRPEGKIRIAAVRAAQYLCVSMVSCFDEPFREQSRESPETREFAKNQFCTFAMRTEQLVSAHFEPRFKKYRYLDALPVGIYKSLQQLLNESILTCDHFEKIYADFLTKRKQKSFPNVHQTGHA